MEETRLAWLFRQYFYDQLNPELELEFFSMLKSGRHTADLEQLMEAYWEKFDSAGQPFDQLTKIRMLNTVYAAENDTATVKAKTIRWPVITAFAAAIAIITLGIWLYDVPGVFGGRYPEPGSGSRLANDIAAGKNGAILKLANGKVIALSDTKTGIIIAKNSLKYNDGSAIGAWAGFGYRDGRNGVHAEQAMQQVQMLTVATSKSQTYQITLPDGTKVWLNADSKINFPSQFDGKERKIKISGELYFEVFKNKTRPFIVESEAQKITVLGTHFNVTAYKGEEIKTTLLEGSVQVQSADVRKNIILRPNQQSIFTTSNEIKVTDVDAAIAIAWKNGRFAFNRASLETVLREMGRWYNVDIKYPDGIPAEWFTGNIDRHNTLAQTLDILKFMKVNFEIDGRTIIVKK